jgi:hypothetical protein
VKNPIAITLLLNYLDSFPGNYLLTPEVIEDTLNYNLQQSIVKIQPSYKKFL